MTSCMFPARLLPRLRHLPIVAADTGILQHILLSLTPSRVSMTATSGRMLVQLQAPTELDGDPVNLLLNARFLAHAAATLLDADGASQVRLSIESERSECRLTRGPATAVVPLVDAASAYPDPWRWLSTRFQSPLVPSIASLDPALVALATKVIGRRSTAPLWWQACVEQPIATTWTGNPAQEPRISASALAKQAASPAVFADESLLCLIMPIVRTLAGAPDLQAHLPVTAAVPAVA